MQHVRGQDGMSCRDLTELVEVESECHRSMKYKKNEIK